MTNSDDFLLLSPTVVHVIDKFIAAMRADDGIEGDAIDRLEVLLRHQTVPKPDDISTALFEPPQDEKT